MPSLSYWEKGLASHTAKSLDKDIQTDVVIIGAGHTGLMTAYLMKQAGLKVVVLERDHCGHVNTGHTSAHLTCVTDLRPTQLIKQFGKETAQAIVDGGQVAIALIEDIVKRENIDCHFSRVPGYLHSSWDSKEDESKAMRQDAESARALGLPAAFQQTVPWLQVPGVSFADQARIHPLLFLKGLQRSVDGDGCAVYEQSEVTEVKNDPLCVKANGHSVHCSYLVIATDVPLQGINSMLDATLFQTKIAPYTSYVISARVPPASVPDALFWDTSDPYYFVRRESVPGQDYVIFGGMDHKTGQEEDAEARYTTLVKNLQRVVPAAEVTARWSGQVVESVDGLPYIGEIADKQFIATGYSGNGLTYGALAGWMACDAALGRSTPWKDLFDPSRKRAGAIWNYLKQNVDFPYYLIKDRLASLEEEPLDNLKAGQGKLMKVEGQRVAAYRDDTGKVTLLSPVCTHLGCIVHWNARERTWDCPCHGSRFQATGEVLAGPAERALESAKARK